MTERLEEEIELLRRAGWTVEVGLGFQWIIVKAIPLPEGWNQADTDVLIKMRPGYPTTPPDNFYADGSLRLAEGDKPGNAPREETIDGQSWLLFSYHVEGGSWSPHAQVEEGHNLLTYLNAVIGRLGEAD